ncbi:hypothetical protein [Catelliglobosispora koreensis]|uniref:hypothetical protein n=1 Tax=Catelliglobosispora koreensis TaxID=129052 RepID=UPI00036E4A58|nr:hypothetical protein [Catelliglobosispora koreensis]
MLETIREYGLEKTGQTAYAPRHAAYFTELAERAETFLRGGEQLPWLRVLRADHDNFDTALRDRITAGDVTMGTRLVAALGWYWWLAGYRAEGSRLAAEVLEMPMAVPDDIRARAYSLSAINTLDGRGDIPLAIEWFTKAAEIVADTGARHPMLKLAPPMALLASWAVDGIGLAPDPVYAKLFNDDDPWVVATARTFHAHAMVNLGQAAHKVVHEFEQALEGYRDLGDRWGMALALEALSAASAQRGDFAGAAAHAREAISLLAVLGTSEDLLQLRMRLTQALWMTGHEAEAIATLTEAQHLAEQLGITFMQAMVEAVWAEVERARGNYAAAWRRLTVASDLVADVSVAPQFRAFAAHTKGLLAGAEGQLETARQAHTEAVEYALSSGDYPVVALSLVGCADLVLREGNPDLAARLLGASEKFAGTVDHSIMDLPRITAAVQEALSPERFAAAYQLGRAATIDNVPALVSGA